MSMDKQRKKELAASYVLADRPAGVFRLVHLSSGKSFVGSTADLNAIFNRHRFQLEMGVHRNHELQKDWKEYGEEAFKFEVLERFKPPETGQYDLKKELERMEEMWLEKLSPYGEQGYHKERN